jgi:hypothetical protein
MERPVTIQTTYPFMTWYNLSFNYKVFKDKLNISVRAVNYFEKTRDYKTTIKDPNFYTTNVTKQISVRRTFTTWNFGKLTKMYRRKKV